MHNDPLCTSRLFAYSVVDRNGVRLLLSVYKTTGMHPIHRIPVCRNTQWTFIGQVTRFRRYFLRLIEQDVATDPCSCRKYLQQSIMVFLFLELKRGFSTKKF